jgi:hypothetical protein
MNLTNSFKTLSNEIEKDVYKRKLKTDSQNRFVEVHLFRVEHMIKQTMVMLTRTVYDHYEDARLTPP